MSARGFPAAAMAAVTFAGWLHWEAPAIAQESSTPQPAPSAAPAATPVPLSNVGEEILKLSRTKIGDDVMIAFIQNDERRHTATATEIIYLHKEGVSDRVLTAMLNQQARTSVAQTPPQAAAPATDAFASAPQYVAPPTTTVVEQTSPASTVYAVGNTPTYYSFADPWPYWYDSWPCYYPYFSLGFAWGWGWGGWYNGYWNSYCHNGYHGGYYGHNGHNGYHGHGDHNGHDGNHYSSPSRGGGQASGARPQNGGPPGDGSPPSHKGSAGRGGQPGTHASNGTSPGGANQSRSDAGRAAATAPPGRPTSYWSGNGNSSDVARSGQPNAVASRGNPATVTRSGQPNAFASRGSQPGAPSSQAGGPTRTWASSADNRIIAGPSSSQATAQPSRPSSVSRAASVGTASPTGSWTRTGSQFGNRYAGSPSSPQRIAAGSSASYRAGGNSVGTARSSSVSSYRGTMNSGGYRGGGGYGGGSAPRMSSRGGFQGSGGSRGGGGGGSHR